MLNCGPSARSIFFKGRDASLVIGGWASLATCRGHCRAPVFTSARILQICRSIVCRITETAYFFIRTNNRTYAFSARAQCFNCGYWCGTARLIRSCRRYSASPTSNQHPLEGSSPHPIIPLFGLISSKPTQTASVGWPFL
jgi:hypothetical protein